MAIQIKLKNSVVQDSTPSTSDLPAVGEIALNANINSIGGFMRASDNTIVKIFGPGSLSTPTATTTVSGISELATNSETTTGTATNRVVTPAGLKAVTDAERATSNSAYMVSSGGTLTGALTMPNGSNSAAAINFGDSDSGIFGGTNTVSLTAGGTTRLTADTGVSVVGTLAVTGAITSTSDLTIADKIIHAGDTDTAIGFLANTVSVETGGSEAVRVDSSQRLLVGTSSSRSIGGNTQKIFQIEGTDAQSGIAITRNSATNTASLISFGKSRGTSNGTSTIVQNNDQLGRINFSGADGTDLVSEAAKIEAFVDGTPGANDMPGRLVFSTTADGADASTTRLTIDSAGLATFTGQITSNGNITIQNTGSAISLVDTDNDSDFQIKNNNGTLFFRDTTNSTNRITIDSAGVVDVTNNLNANGGLDVTGAITATTSITATGDLTATGNLNIGNNSSTNPFSKLTFGASQFGSAEIRPTDESSHTVGLSFYTDGTVDSLSPTERARITSAGAVLINTTSTSLNHKLQVEAHSSDATGIAIFGRAADDISQLDFYENDKSTKLGELQYRQDHVNFRHRVGYIAFATGGTTERARIDSDGRLGLGLTPNTSDVATNVSPGLFQTDGNIDIRYSGTNSDPAGARYLNFINTDTTLVAGQPMGGLHWIGMDSDNPNSITAAILADCSGNAGTSSHLLFKTAGSERMRIDATTGNVGIGTTPDSPLHVHKGSAGTVSADGNAVLALENSNHCVLNMLSPADKSAYIMFGDPDDINAGQIRYDNNTNQLLVEVNASERLRIDDSGNVGIGTSSPATALHIACSGNDNGIRLIDSSVSGGAPNLEIIGKRSDTNSNTAFAANIFLARHGTSGKCTNANILGSISFGGNHTDASVNNISYAACIRAAASNSFDSKTDMPTDLVFCTGTSGTDSSGEQVGDSNVGAERMRINSSGEVRIGNTGSIGLGTNGTLIPQSGIFKHSRDTGNTTATAMFFGANGKLFILGDGDCENTNNRYTGFSDQRLKENIVDANSQWDDIKALKIRNYNFKESTGFNTHKQIGVIAQELEASGMNGLVKNVADELYVEGDELPEGKNIGDVKEEGHKSVAYSVLYMKAIKALQEAMAKIEILETKVAALEAA